MMNKNYTIADYMSWLNKEKTEKANNFLNFIRENKTDKTQEELYNTLTIEELEKYAAEKE